MSLFSKISSLLSGDNLDKAIALGFSRFDKDQSGFIEKSEVLGVIETIVKTTGLNWAPPGALIDGVFSKVRCSLIACLIVVLDDV
ncbi:hypothetical protein MNEG_3924 [Monoraphidium neglectum]|uniref:EF-hand domain-containing protein n=1 Tax=Monoraphidium neglectum TaxID=145388 RepID=A0A0D2MMP5_9CHLO|nr:hypothetical protein MNEG_3924 [Monoraphidium neglectum]KIZ04040.1 hypothetical protein MNEG_3924 [Monoraphidium neglectum]|eukprot:XP_013903059.1 hypothetical protein MNEG_3924 [Monoraphidium neglectum]